MSYGFSGTFITVNGQIMHPTYSFTAKNQFCGISAYNATSYASGTMTIASVPDPDTGIAPNFYWGITNAAGNITSSNGYTNTITQNFVDRNTGLYISDHTLTSGEHWVAPTGIVGWTTFLITYTFGGVSSTLRINGYDSSADFILVNTSQYPTLISLPSADTISNNKAIFIKDANFNAKLHPISIQVVNNPITGVPGRIDNKPFYTLNQNGHCLSFFSDGTLYFVSSIYPSTSPGTLPTQNLFPGSLDVQSNTASAVMNQVNIYNTDIPPLYPVYGNMRETGTNSVKLPTLNCGPISSMSQLSEGIVKVNLATTYIPPYNPGETAVIGGITGSGISGYNGTFTVLTSSGGGYNPTWFTINSTLSGTSLNYSTSTTTGVCGLCMVVYAGGPSGKRDTYKLGFVTSDWQHGLSGGSGLPAVSSRRYIDGNTAYTATNAPCISTGHVTNAIVQTLAPDTLVLASAYNIVPKSAVTVTLDAFGLDNGVTYYVANTYTPGSTRIPLSSTIDGSTPLATVNTSTVVSYQITNYSNSLMSSPNTLYMPSAASLLKGTPVTFGTNPPGTIDTESYYVFATTTNSTSFQVTSINGGTTPVTLTDSAGSATQDIPLNVTGVTNGSGNVAAFSTTTFNQYTNIVNGTSISVTFSNISVVTGESNLSITSSPTPTTFNGTISDVTSTTFTISGSVGKIPYSTTIGVEGSDPPNYVTTTISTPTSTTATQTINVMGWNNNVYITDKNYTYNANPLTLSFTNYTATAPFYAVNSSSTGFSISTSTVGSVIPLTGYYTTATLGIKSFFAYTSIGEGSKSSGIVFFTEGKTWYVAGWYDPTKWIWDISIPANYSNFYDMASVTSDSQFAITISANVNSFITLPNKLISGSYFIIVKTNMTIPGTGTIGFSTYRPRQSNLINANGTMQIYWNGGPTYRSCIWFVSETREDESFIR